MSPVFVPAGDLDVPAGFSKTGDTLLLSPLRYDEFIHLMSRSVLILTDSGGIQEEAPALGKPVVVLRNTTERPEIVTAGVGLLVGTDPERIIQTVHHLLINKNAYQQMVRGVSPYGDGLAAQRIVDCLERDLLACKEKPLVVS